MIYITNILFTIYEIAFNLRKFFANVPNNQNKFFFSKNRIKTNLSGNALRHRKKKCNINLQVFWTHPPNFVLLWGANMVETVLYSSSSRFWRASVVDLAMAQCRNDENLLPTIFIVFVLSNFPWNWLAKTYPRIIMLYIDFTEFSKRH